MALRVLRAGTCIAARVGVGGALLAALLSYADISAQQPAKAAAAATCDTHHTNVQAYDSGGNGSYGDQANMYVNTYATLSTLQDTIARTLLVYNDAQTSNVEFGWDDDNGGYYFPVVTTDHEVQGTTQPPSFWPGYALSYDTYVNFRIENIGNQGIFRYVVGNEASPIAYSPTMGFNSGWPTTNSEHYNSCDTLWTDMKNLEDQYGIQPAGWESYVSVSCWHNSSVNDWYLHQESSDEIQVNQSSSGGQETWGNGCADTGS